MNRRALMTSRIQELWELSMPAERIDRELVREYPDVAWSIRDAAWSAATAQIARRLSRELTQILAAP